MAEKGQKITQNQICVKLLSNMVILRISYNTTFVIEKETLLNTLNELNFNKNR